MIMKREYDFEDTWTTIPLVRDASAQGVDGGGACACVCRTLARITAYGGHTGASRVALRDVHRMTVSGRRQGERSGLCARAVQGVAGHCADEDEEDDQKRAVRGQNMVQVVCRQQWKQCDTDSGESSSNMYATPPDSMAIVRVQGVAVIVDCNEENERDGLLVRVQGCDRLRRATSCKFRHRILSSCLFLYRHMLHVWMMLGIVRSLDWCVAWGFSSLLKTFSERV
jgi:hypothetical protein